MVRSELKKQAKEQLKGNLWMIVLASLIVGVISGACGFVPLVGSIVTLVIGPAFTLGMTMIYLNVTYGDQADVATLFDGFKNFGTAFLTNLLIGIFTMLWSLLLIVPGIIKAISYSMSFYILAENPEMSATEAINESKEIMDGHKMEYFILNLSFLPWFLLCIVTLGIAAIYVTPYVSLTYTDFYHNIKRKKSTIQVKEVKEQPAIEEVKTEGSEDTSINLTDIGETEEETSTTIESGETVDHSADSTDTTAHFE